MAAPGVDSAKHAMYGHALEHWQTCRDVFGGAKVVKAAGVRYLPRLSGQTPEEYEAYKQRANFYNVFKRTVGGLTGTVFTRAPGVELPDVIRPHLADITLAGEPFDIVARGAVSEVLKVGRYGMLLDYSTAQRRPFWSMYTAEQICDWDTEQRNGDTVLTWLVLKECFTERAGFEKKTIDQYRVLELQTEPVARCVVTTWRKTKNQQGQEAWTIHDTIVPERLGAPLAFIPFVCFNPTGIGLGVDDPPLMDLVDVNLAHYRNSADFENGLHFTGLPTLFVRGIPLKTEIKVGSGEAIVADNKDADAKFIEFTGQGLKPSREAMADKETQMAVLGSRLLEKQKVAAEAAATVRMRHAGDNATLQDIVGAVSLGFTVAFRLHAFWAGATDRIDDDRIKVDLNTDFIADTQDLNTLALLRQSGDISQATLYWNLERAGLTRPGITLEEEQEQIRAEGGDPNQGDDLPTGRGNNDDRGAGGAGGENEE
jgi:hypothetical protein